MERDLRIAVFGQKRLSREGGVEIVVKELCTRMAQQGCHVTCYNRSGHHVSGAEYDDIDNTNYEGIRQKCVPTIEKKGARDIIRGCHNRDKGTTENERLRNPKFIFSYPKNTSQPFCAIRVQSSLTTISTPPSLDNRFCPNIAIASFLLINLSHNPTQFLHLYFSQHK